MDEVNGTSIPEASHEQTAAALESHEQARASVLNNQRPRIVRDRRINRAHVRGHIPRPRNSWIIYRSDKTRELRNMDPSLTASDICE